MIIESDLGSKHKQTNATEEKASCLSILGKLISSTFSLLLYLLSVKHVISRS